MKFIPALIAAFMLFWPTVSQAQDKPKPSFDCAKAREPVEILICADVALAREDATVARNYKALRGVWKGRLRRSLRKDQRRWIGARDRGCRIGKRTVLTAGSRPRLIKCLIAAYRKRNEVLTRRLQKAGASKPVSRASNSAPRRKMSPEVEALYAKAKGGDSKARNELGNAYEFGEGIRQNEAEALKWYILAAKGSYAAKISQAVLQEDLPPHQAGIAIQWARAVEPIERKPLFPRCESPQTQNEMNNCDRVGMLIAKKRLDRVVFQFRKKHAVRGKLLLESSQKTYLAYAQSNCGYVSDASRGGQMEMGAYFGCMRINHQTRLKALKTLLATKGVVIHGVGWESKYERRIRGLNTHYRKLRKMLDEEAFDLLKSAQRYYVAFRDATCAWYAGRYPSRNLARHGKFRCLAWIEGRRARVLEFNVKHLDEPDARGRDTLELTLPH